MAESAGAVTLMVQRVNDTNTPVSVEYATADGTATNGLKYTAVATESQTPGAVSSVFGLCWSQVSPERELSGGTA